ncbi:hypothetical protein C8F01DRAFT_1210252 [Mycena amicta]|nr:hypothetical protein C8F01DRAFT_1210252 [Mycena amicta]
MLSRLWLALFAPVVVFAHSDNWHHRNRETVQKIYDLTVYPHNVPIITQGADAVPHGLFNVNASGRVAPVGEFVGFQDSIEYFWGLAPIPTGVAPNGVFSKATLVEFTSGCPSVAASTVYLQVNTLNPDNSTGAYLTTLKQVAFWRFDNHGAVLKYDAWIPNLDPVVSLMHGSGDVVDPGTGMFTPPGEAATIASICGLQTQTCVGTNQVYNGMQDCVEQLGKKPFGRYDEAWGDNVVCRSVHVLLTRIRPEVHCMHVGPTGGGKCINVHYNDAYFDDKALFGGNGQSTFSC